MSLQTMKRERDNVNLYTVGYYICEPVEMPGCFGIERSEIYSVSKCIGYQHPELFWQGHDKQAGEYMHKFGFSAEEFHSLYDETWDLFNNHLLDLDSRFKRLEDAEYFYQKYYKGTNLALLSISLDEKHLEDLREYWPPQEEINGVFYGSNIDYSDGFGDKYNPAQQSLGCDILGWEAAYFHSFLCNSLHKDLPDARFNEYGLLDNPYEEVERFAEEIQGQGEPVLWLPYQIGLCEIGIH